VEYQRRRLNEISSAHNKTAKVLTDIDKALEGYWIAVEKADLKERGVEIEGDPLRRIKALALDVRNTVEATLAGQLRVNEHDTIRDELDRLFQGKVGPAPGTQQELDAWNDLGKVRFAMKRGPGYEDASKAEGDEPQFLAQSLVYERQYGDLYIWLQLLDHVKNNAVKNVVFVTMDGKEDWWRLAPGQGKNRDKLAPLESLVEEICAAGADRFWMYQWDKFLKEAEEHLKVTVSELTIKDARQTDDQSQAEEISSREREESLTYLQRRILGVPKYGVRQLRAALELTGATCVQASDSTCFGYIELEGKGPCGVMFVMPNRLVAFSPERKMELQRSVERLVSMLAVSSITAYVLCRGVLKTIEESIAMKNLKMIITEVVPSAEVSVMRARFADRDLSELVIDS